jgi:dihydroxyacetone kinase-like protein
MAITSRDIIAFLERAAQLITEHSSTLTELDAAIGDADHGANLERGFNAVRAKLDGLADQDIGTIMRTAGSTLVSTVGGSSGPLYGTAFIRAGTVLAGKTSITPEEWLAAAEAGLDGIIARGKARAGEKTLIDAIEPAIAAYRAALAEGVSMSEMLRRSAAAAEAGAQATIPMLATKGRASYLGDRSIGHQDPGATSAYYLTLALLEVVEEAEARQ